MIKTLKTMLKQDKEKYRIPKNIQDIIPIQTVYNDGIFKVGKTKFSKTFKFTDINYSVASSSEKENIMQIYCELLNSLDTGTTVKITVNNRNMCRADFEKGVLISDKGDGLDEYRQEYNEILLEKSSSTNSIVQEKYITISIYKKNIEDARVYFNRIHTTLNAHFSRLGSICTELAIKERLKIIYDFYNKGDSGYFDFDIKHFCKYGYSFKDSICPESMEIKSDYIKIGDRYARVLYLKSYASVMKDSLIRDITSLNKNLMMSLDILSMPTDEAIKEVENCLLGIETNMSNYQRRQVANNNFYADVPYQSEQQQRHTKELLDEILNDDQRMTYGVVTVVHTAESKKELDSDTENILSIARSCRCQMKTLKYRQIDGLNTALPFGVRNIENFRTLLTKSLAMLVPFKVQDIFYENGIYYGLNTVSNNMIIADRRELMNGNSFILGVSGGGKSFMAKHEIINLILSTNADIIVIDPEKEYVKLFEKLGGEIINISSTSSNRINAMDINKNYGDGLNPIIAKSEFMMSFFEHLTDNNSQLNARQKSIIDRCTANVYEEYRKNGYNGELPTLNDFREELLKQKEEEAISLALELELYSQGSLGVFAQQTNVDTNNRLICYDILDLGEHLLPLGMLIILDSILNRITKNRAMGKNTFIFIDEIYLLFKHQFSANYLATLWKRVRKYGAYCTGITQNVYDLLESTTAKTMLSNSEFVIMLNQSPNEIDTLAKTLNIADDQLSAITNAQAGCGLIKVGGAIIPFANIFPKNTSLYKLMSTKFNESEFS